MLKTNEDIVIDALLDIVAKVGTSPKIVSPFGFRVVALNGERVLTPLGAAEYRDIMAAAGKPVEEGKFGPDPADWGCVATNAGCQMTFGGHGGCCKAFHQGWIIGISCEGHGH